MTAPAPISSFISAPDGLRLHARCHGRRSQMALPVLCLPGLARTAADFDALAGAPAAPDCRPAIIVGTSRGGVLAMLLAALRPSAIAGCVLNDIGPVIEPKGLMRIKGYVGKLPQPRSFEEAAEILRRPFDAQFTKLTPA